MSATAEATRLAAFIATLQRILDRHEDMPITFHTGADPVEGVRLEVMENMVRTPSGELVEPDPDTDDEEEAKLCKLERMNVLAIMPGSKRSG
jgi:hypothetical protein